MNTGYAHGFLSYPCSSVFIRVLPPIRRSSTLPDGLLPSTPNAEGRESCYGWPLTLQRMQKETNVCRTRPFAPFPIRCSALPDDRRRTADDRWGRSHVGTSHALRITHHAPRITFHAQSFHPDGNTGEHRLHTRIFSYPCPSLPTTDTPRSAGRPPMGTGPTPASHALPQGMNHAIISRLRTQEK